MATTSTRVYIDCAEIPDSTCSVKISGRPDEVLKVAIDHAVSAHGEQNTPELVAMIESHLKPEAA